MAKPESIIINNYEIFRDGSIKMLSHYRKNKWGGDSLFKEKYLAQSNDRDGYKLVTMKKMKWSKNGQIRVHRLVAFCFLGSSDKNFEVNHIDGNKANNCVENLEYVTSKENKIHAVKHGLMKKGKKHHRSKTIIANRNGINLEMTGVEEIIKNGFRPQSAHRAARGERKKYNGWEMKYIKMENK